MKNKKVKGKQLYPNVCINECSKKMNYSLNNGNCNNSCKFWELRQKYYKKAISH